MRPLQCPFEFRFAVAVIGQSVLTVEGGHPVFWFRYRGRNRGWERIGHLLDELPKGRRSQRWRRRRARLIQAWAEHHALSSHHRGLYETTGNTTPAATIAREPTPIEQAIEQAIADCEPSQ